MTTLVPGTKFVINEQTGGTPILQGMENAGDSNIAKNIGRK